MKVTAVESWPMAALVRREFLTLIRSARVFLALAVFVAAGIATVWSAWPDEGFVASRAAATSRGILSRLSFLLLGGCAVFVPPLAAVSIVGERERDTLDLLRLALIRSEGIILGKLLNAVGFYLALVAATLPALGAGLYLVGLEPAELTWTFLLLLATGVCCGMAGIAASACARKTLWALGLAFAFALLSVTLMPAVAGSVLWIPLAPFVAQKALTPLSFTPPGTLGGIHAQVFVGLEVSVAILAQLALAVCWFGVAQVGLRAVSPEPPRVPQFKPIDDPHILHLRRTTWPFYLIDPRARKKPIEDGRNPMMMKELRYGVHNRGDLMVWTFIVTFIIGLFGAATVWLNPNDPDPARFWMTLMLVGMVLAAPALLANALTKEYELGNINMLRMTLLTPGQILGGKLLAGAMVLAPVLGGAAASCLLIVQARPQDTAFVLGGCLTLLVSAVLSLGLGLLASLLTLRTGTALILTYAFSLFVFFGTTFLARLYDSYFSVTRPGGSVGPGSVLSWNLDSPIFAYLRSMGGHPALPGAWLANLAVYSALCAAVLLVSVQGFARYRLRET